MAGLKDNLETERQFFSVIIPVYNMGKKIIRCITSIQNNTYRNFEVIIVDDGSTDNTVEIVRQIVANDLRFKLVLQNHAGPSAARNRGIIEAKGDIVSFIDSDDYIEEDYFNLLC